MIKARVKKEYCISFDRFQEVKLKIGDVFEFVKTSDSLIEEGYMITTSNVFPEEIKKFTFSRDKFETHFELEVGQNPSENLHGIPPN